MNLLCFCPQSDVQCPSKLTVVLTCCQMELNGHWNMICSQHLTAEHGGGLDCQRKFGHALLAVGLWMKSSSSCSLTGWMLSVQMALDKTICNAMVVHVQALACKLNLSKAKLFLRECYKINLHQPFNENICKSFGQKIITLWERAHLDSNTWLSVPDSSTMQLFHNYSTKENHKWRIYQGGLLLGDIKLSSNGWHKDPYPIRSMWELWLPHTL